MQFLSSDVVILLVVAAVCSVAGVAFINLGSKAVSKEK